MGEVNIRGGNCLSGKAGGWQPGESGEECGKIFAKKFADIKKICTFAV
jgi:hypothetical protein